MYFDRAKLRNKREKKTFSPVAAYWLRFESDEYSSRRFADNFMRIQNDVTEY